jgi:hypothetical protein
MSRKIKGVPFFFTIIQTGWIKIARCDQQLEMCDSDPAQDSYGSEQDYEPIIAHELTAL